MYRRRAAGCCSPGVHAATHHIIVVGSIRDWNGYSSSERDIQSIPTVRNKRHLRKSRPLFDNGLFLLNCSLPQQCFKTSKRGRRPIGRWHCVRVIAWKQQFVRETFLFSVFQKLTLIHIGHPLRLRRRWGMRNREHVRLNVFSGRTRRNWWASEVWRVWDCRAAQDTPVSVNVRHRTAPFWNRRCWWWRGVKNGACGDVGKWSPLSVNCDSGVWATCYWPVGNLEFVQFFEISHFWSHSPSRTHCQLWSSNALFSADRAVLAGATAHAPHLRFLS